MEKYLKRLCEAILADRFNDVKYREKGKWHGKNIQTEPLFCSYGAVGFTVMVYDCYKHFCTVQWDGDLKELTIDDTPWKEYINLLFLENFDIIDCGNGDLECYTDAGGDMIIPLDRVRKKDLQQYLDDFDINEEIILWWAETTSMKRKEKGLPFDNIKQHYEDLEKWMNFMQGVCYKMPY